MDQIKLVKIFAGLAPLFEIGSLFYFGCILILTSGACTIKLLKPVIVS